MDPHSALAALEAFAKALDLPWIVWDGDRVVAGQSGKLPTAAWLASCRQLAEGLAAQGDACESAAIVEFRYFERFAVCPYGQLWVAIGPGVDHALDPAEIDRATGDGVHEPLGKPEFRELASRLPTMSHERWVAVAKTLDALLGTGAPADRHPPILWITRVPSSSDRSLTAAESAVPDETWFEHHHFVYTSRHDVTREREMLRCVRTGDVEGMRALQAAIRRDRSGVGVLSKRSEIRNRKNIGICAITLATRAAVEAGVDVETAYGMSDAWIQTLEDASTLVEVETCVDRALVAFARAAHKAQSSSRSRHVREAEAYLRQHVTKRVRMADVARHVGVHPHHLAARFKAETGQTLTEALWSMRIEAAKEMLRDSRMSVGEIAALLQFTDQSHFARRFRQATGLSPRAFRTRCIAEADASQVIR
ncbi:helix-turn-helix transcriptional regulator [Alicyclobacillus vulcanalis]|uniref:AraC-type DNA-binding protein n=1 Tax=Alicyclobacillus vulcanalis TaxID=252246 RepID=A0A1N7P3N8_9BACL|nr:AraC family transcriptional regulator [Alicyclobacillus vulcanalis]SIT05049.1 AraC-type DNA-binding protein [Alicyclobacillus vulcanalis]